MLGRETGAIVDCSSAARLVGFPQLPAYIYRVVAVEPALQDQLSQAGGV